MQKYDKIRSRREEHLHQANTMRGGKLMPIMAHGLRPGEKAVISQEVDVELEPIAGRLITDVHARVTAVFVPALAIDAAIDPAATHPGNEEIFRQRMLADENVFPLEAENEISRRCGIRPWPQGSERLVSSAVRVAHAVAVNYLRRRVYTEAAQIPATTDTVTPAIVSTTVLDRFNGVLDPEDRVNGAVHLTGKLPVKGIGIRHADGGDDKSALYMRESGGGDPRQATVFQDGSGETFLIEENPNKPGYPQIVVDFADANTTSLSIADFYTARKMDQLTREIRALIDRYPEYGPEMAVRLVHGFQVETGKTPYMLYQKTVPLMTGVKSAMDGPNLDMVRTRSDGYLDYSLPVDGGEFGGIVITFLEVKPEEVIADQPHPVLASKWTVDNHALQELAVEPVPVYMKQLDCEIDPASADVVSMWVGPEHFKRRYECYGFNRGVDVSTVEHKSAMWRYALPLSVSASNILYPETLDHYPFALNAPTDDAVSYSCASSALYATPTILGPTPVENLPILDDENVLPTGDDPQPGFTPQPAG